MLETVSLRVTDGQGAPVDYGFTSVALKDEGCVGWHVAVSALGNDSWLVVADMLVLPSEAAIDPKDAKYTACVVQALGVPWDTLYANLHEVAESQVAQVERIGPVMSRKFQESEPEDVWAWREQFQQEPYTTGEIMRQALTGVLPFAGRN